VESEDADVTLTHEIEPECLDAMIWMLLVY
jgi:hypothetical protein